MRAHLLVAESQQVRSPSSIIAPAVALHALREAVPEWRPPSLTCPSRFRRRRRGSRSASRCERHIFERKRPVGARRQRHGELVDGEESRSSPLQSRVQRIVQALPDERDREHGQQDRQARNRRHVPLRAQTRERPVPMRLPHDGHIGIGQIEEGKRAFKKDRRRP